MVQDRSLQAQKETVRVPLFSQANYDPFGSTLDQTYINCFPEVIRDPTTGEGSTRIIKRQGLIDVPDLDLFETTGAASKSDIYPMGNIVVSQLDDIYVCALGDITANKIYIVQYRPLALTSTLIGTLTSVSNLDWIHLNECQIVSGGVVRAGITVVWTKLDRSQSNCYHAVSNGTVFTAASLTLISNVAFPDKQTPSKVVTGPMQQMNGIFYAYTTDGIIFNSGSTTGTENDPTSWSTLSNILTYQYPDGGISISRYKHHIIAVGKDSIEFFNDIGNPPPATRLERTEQAFIKFGAISPYTVINVDDTLYWLSYSSSSTLGLWKLDGYTPVKESTGKEDYKILILLQSGVTLSIPRLFTIIFQNKKHIGIVGVTTQSLLNTVVSPSYGNLSDSYHDFQNTGGFASSSTIMYNVEDKTWWAFSFAPYQNSSLFPANSYPGYGSTTKFFIQYTLIADQINGGSSTSGCRVYQVTQSTAGAFVDYDPDGIAGIPVPVPITIQVNTLNFGNLSRKRISKVQVVFTSIPVIFPSDDRVYSISLLVNKGNLSTGAGTLEKIINYPNAVNRYYWNNLGSARYWTFAIQSLNKDPFSAEALDLEVHQGTH